jgi:N utilization substance protein B
MMLSSLIEIRKKEIEFLEKSRAKHPRYQEERNPNRKFVDNYLQIA